MSRAWLRYLPCVVLLVGLLAVTSVARADVAPTCDELCSVNRSCSSTGVACLPGDRECTGRAASAGLEIRCEQRCDTGERFVYCPPDSGRGDSGYVWILLSLALIIAVGGTLAAWLVLRKKA